MSYQVAVASSGGDDATMAKCKVESQRKPKDPPQSSRTWTRPSQSDSGRDSRSQQQVHNIANQHPIGEAPRRQDYPP
jgi:hypothetical protein